MDYPKDLRDHLQLLEKSGKLTRIKREINKDTELHPLVRLQFRGLPKEERKAFLFENVVDVKGKKYDVPVVICALGASREIYALGMNCDPDKILDKWAEVQLHPIEPVLIDDGPVHEEIHVDKGLLEHGGLEEFPITISTPGYDAGPFIASPYWVSKDPETEVVNVGTYRVHVKSPLKTGIMWHSVDQHIARHWEKCRKMGIPLKAALVVGAAPNIGLASVSKLSSEVNEFAFAGAIAGYPVELVKCITADLEVPASAEIVLEGEFSMDEVEPEAPFGEALGFMGHRKWMPYFTIKCITHRKNPIWQTFLSQFPPSESSMIRGVGREGAIYKYLKYDCNQPWVLKVAMNEATGVAGVVIIQVSESDQAKVWETLEAVSKWVIPNSPNTKLVIAVGEDIDPDDADAVMWAFSFRVQPHRDCRTVTYPGRSLMDYSLAPPEAAFERDARYERMPEASHLLVNSTIKWHYPPVSLPRKEFMERALKIWEEEKLPPLKLRQPWFGYSLGYWPAEFVEQAELAVRGEYKLVGDMLAKQGRKL
jgi:UbiD family decarboxylase